ncbi:23 kDa integral membrane protein-like [Ornithodoros turicata]|uniref:23 kDa integral membrane protein-like n=1 Tax=Ornithodoros turicata TaxID=34597 RepID=UPI0031386F0E
MAQGCGMKCIKNLLFIFNFFFAVSGILIIVCGGYSLHWFKNTGPVIGEHYIAGPVILIVIGSVVFLVAFLGCCGAMQESYCMLMLFSVFLFLILVAEIAAGALGFANKDKIQNLAKKQFESSMKDYSRTSDKPNPTKLAWDFIQTELKCCGTDGPQDWGTPTNLPQSCCDSNSNVCTSTSSYQRGCFTTLKEKLEKYSLYVGIAGIGIGLIEIIGIVFACCLSNHLK